MTRIANIGRIGLDFTLGSKGGAPIVEHLKAGEARDIDVDVMSAQVQGRLAAGVIAVESFVRSPRKAATLPPPPAALIDAVTLLIPATKRRRVRRQ